MLHYLERHYGCEDGYFWEPPKGSLAGFTDSRIENAYVNCIDPFKDGSVHGKIGFCYYFKHKFRISYFSLLDFRQDKAAPSKSTCLGSAELTAGEKKMIFGWKKKGKIC
jgi:hypothetical protein